jgi:hypothetical protein
MSCHYSIVLDLKYFFLTRFFFSLTYDPTSDQDPNRNIVATQYNVIFSANFRKITNVG